jgi:hypothetical protein
VGAPGRQVADMDMDALLDELFRPVDILTSH